MTNNVLQFVIDSLGNIINSDEGSLKALSNLTSRIQVVTSFDSSVSISVNYLVYDSTNRRLKQYLIPVNKYGRDVIPTSSPIYNEAHNWNVYEIDINDRILSYISKHRAGKIGVSFNITQSVSSSKILRMRGYVGVNKPFPTEDLLDGDGVIVDDYNFVYEGNLYNKGDYLYYNEDNLSWLRTKHINLGLTSTRDIAVDPSVSYQDGDFDENLLAEFIGGFNDSLINKQNITDSSLLTSDKTIPGAINELLYELENIDLSDYYTKTEIDNKDVPNDNIEYVRKNKEWVIPSVIKSGTSVFEAGKNIRNIAPLNGGLYQTDIRQDSDLIYFRGSKVESGSVKTLGNIEINQGHPSGASILLKQQSYQTPVSSSIFIRDENVMIYNDKLGTSGVYIFDAQNTSNSNGVIRRKDLNSLVSKDTSTSTYDKVYGKLTNGNQITFEINNIDGIAKYNNSRLKSELPLVNADVANKEYVDTSVNNIVLPDHYKGQIDDISLLPATSTYNGDFYYVLDLGSEYNNLAGNATWNGNDNIWDIAPDKVFNPDYNTIGLDSLGRLTTVKLPNKLTIQGQEYDGSEAKTINILPSKPNDEVDKLLGWDGNGNLTWKSAVLEHDQLTGLNADEEYQHITLNEKQTLEFTTNKTNNVNILSTHNQYPTAKAVYEALGNLILNISFEEGV